MSININKSKLNKKNSGLEARDQAININKSKLNEKNTGLESHAHSSYCLIVNKTNNNTNMVVNMESEVKTETTNFDEKKCKNFDEQKISQVDGFELKIKESCINYQFAYELNLRGKQSDVLSAIYIVASSSGVCFATNEWLSNHFRLCKNTISNYVKKFEELGLIVSEHFKRVGKHVRNLYLTEKFFEMAEKCGCTRIKRNFETWEEKRTKIENTKKVAAKPIKSTYTKIFRQRINNNISKDIYIERRDTTVEVKPNKKELLKSYNLVIKEYVDLNFSSDKGLESLLKRFVRVQFKRNRRNDKNWFMLNDELKDHLDELLRLSKGCLISACAIARLTVVQEWGKFYPLTKKKSLNVDKFLQERMQPLFNQVRAYYNEIYGVQSIDEIYGINDDIVNKHKRFEEELSEIKTMVCDMRIELDKRNSLGICDQTNQGTVLIKENKNGQIVELIETKHEETWEEKYGPIDAINNFKKIIDIDPENGKIERVRYETHDYDNFTQKSGSASYSASEWHLKAVPEKEVDPLAKYGFGTVGEAYDLI